MKFLSQEHETRYKQLVVESEMCPGDTERKAFFYIIAGNNELFQRVFKIYNFKESCLKSTRIPLSSSGDRLLKLAKNLYNGMLHKSMSVVDLFGRLDDKNFTLAMEAIKIRFNR